MPDFLRPTFQPQNPALSGYQYGWTSCTSFAFAMGSAYDRGVARLMSGGALRERTGDHTGGTTLAQNDYASHHWGIDLDVRTPVPWEIVQEKRRIGRGVVLQGHGEVFIGTKFFANASVNHCGFLTPDLAFMDPAADGRYDGIYKFHAEPYPEDLLKRFAGRLILTVPSGPRLGYGWAYAAFTRDKAVGHEAVVRPRAGSTIREFTTYEVGLNAAGQRQIIGSPRKRRTAGFVIPCSDPKSVLTRTGAAHVSLVKLVHPGHPQDGWWISSIFEREV